MSYTRRGFLSDGALTMGAAIAGTHMARSAHALPVGTSQELDSDNFRRLIAVAVDAATAAGATYADARITYTLYGRSHRVFGFGVRSLVDGYWGFASSPLLSDSEAAYLGRNSVFNAAANVMRQPSPIELAPLSDPTDGEWIMPVKDDPFVMPEEEISDFIGGLTGFIERLKYTNGITIQEKFLKQDKWFGSSLGQYTAQRLYITTALVGWTYEDPTTGRTTSASLDCLTPAGMGFEYLRDQPLREYILEAHEEAMRDLTMPVEPVDVGRYSLIVNSIGVASLLKGSVGAATQIDRALGYEANAGGTSYIADPGSMIGEFRIGSSSLNIECGRSEPGSVGRVRWDDEGIEPPNFTLVRDGILVNMQTSREGAGWMRSHYEKSGTPYTSFGCTYAPTAIDAPLIHCADMTLQPDRDSSHTLETLRVSMEDGIEFQNPAVSMDFQQISGMARGKAYLIKKGKRTALIANAGTLFRTPELWSSVIALGGKDAVARYGQENVKGEPVQYGYNSITTPPAVFKEMSIIDVKRKA